MTKAQMWGVGIFLVLIIGISVFAGIMSGGKATTANGVYTGKTTATLDATDHVRGGTQSGVSVTEYGDFQCPACGAYEPLVEQLEKAYPQVEFSFRNFPLSQLHPNAMIAAQAAEAAGLQGKYWDMHDLLYQKQSEWSDEANSDVVAKYFDTYATSLGLNVAKFNTDIDSAAVKARIERDVNFANAAQLDHTPTFFVNDKEIQNPASYAAFESIIKDALASASSTPAK